MSEATRDGGPYAQTRWYHEDNRGYLLIDPSSRRWQPGDHYAFYTAAVFDKWETLEFPRLTHAHTGYLEHNCTPLWENEIPESVKATLENLINHPTDGAWDKKWVG